MEALTQTASEKAALLRRAVAHVLAIAPEMVSASCAAANVDPSGPLAGAAWLAGPVACIANLRRYAETLERATTPGHAALTARDLRGRVDDRVVAQLAPATFAERSLYREAPVTALFAAASPEEIVAAQGAPRVGGDLAGEGAAVTEHDPIQALEIALVQRRLVDLVPSSPAIERAFAPLAEGGLLRIVAADAGASRSLARGVTVIAPALFAKDEMAFIVRRIAAEVAAGSMLGTSRPKAILVATYWAQRAMFVDALQTALARLPADRVPAIVADVEPGANEVTVNGVGSEDPVELLPSALGAANALRPSSVEIVVLGLQEEDPAVVVALERMMVALQGSSIGVNEWPEMASFRGEGASGPHMLALVDKTIVRGPLVAWRTPLHFLDAKNVATRGARLAAFHAAPSVRGRLRA